MEFRLEAAAGVAAWLVVVADVDLVGGWVERSQAVHFWWWWVGAGLESWWVGAVMVVVVGMGQSWGGRGVGVVGWGGGRVGGGSGVGWW